MQRKIARLKRTAPNSQSSLALNASTPLTKRTRWLFRASPYLIVLAACLIAGLIVTKPSSFVATIHPSTTCSGAEAQSFSCWQNHFQTETKTRSPEIAFVDLKKVYATNPYVKANCHQLTHVIGRAAALRYSSLAETYKHGDQFCWSGYYHGAVETVAQQLGPAKIISDMNAVCADFMQTERYSFNHYNCVHGMGHGLMAVDDGELFKALSDCDIYTDSWEQQSCYSGVFMENVMNEINPGSHSSYLRADDPLYPCTAVADRYKQQCYLMQTSHALIVENYDYTKVFSVCSSVASPFDTTCFQSLGRDVSGNSSSDQARTVQLCMQGPTESAQENCFTGAVKDFISYYHNDSQGLSMCKAIPDTSLSASCTEVATDYYKTL